MADGLKVYDELLIPPCRRAYHPLYPITFKVGFGPYRIIDPHPSFQKCVDSIIPSDYFALATMALIPMLGVWRRPNRTDLMPVAIGATIGYFLTVARAWSNFT